MGCDALGIPAGLLSATSNFWHAGRIVFDADQGVRMRGHTKAAKRLAAEAELIREQFGGGPVINRDVPVIASAGFSLGRLFPSSFSHRHASSGEEFAANSAACFLSDDFLRAYVAHHRHPQIRVLRRLANRARVTVVPPPVKLRSPIMRASYAAVCDMIRAARLDLYEPLADLAEPGQGLDEGYFSADGAHGNERYGRTVIQRLIERGALGRVAA